MIGPILAGARALLPGAARAATGATGAAAKTGMAARLGMASDMLGGGMGMLATLPLLVDMIRSFGDGGADNADPAKIAAQRDKVVAELVKNGKTPVEARAQVDELLRPLVDEVEAGRDDSATGPGEFLTSLGIAGLGIVTGRAARKKAKTEGKDPTGGAPKDNPKDVATEAPQPKGKPVHQNAPDAPDHGDLDNPKRMGQPDDLYEQDVPNYRRPPPTQKQPEQDYYVEPPERGFTIPAPDGGVMPMSEDELRQMAVMSTLRGMPRRPPRMTPRGEDYSAMPRLGVSDESLGELRARGRRFTPRSDMGGVDIEM